MAGPTSFGYDAATGRLCRIDDHRFIGVGAHTYDVDARRWEAPTPDRPAGGVLVDELWIVGARVLDPVTHQFLSPDPLLAVAGSNGAASAYTYAWHDPVNRVDPSGLRPISIEEFRAIREREEQGRLGQAWEAIKEDPWGTVAMVGVVAAGVGLMFVPGGQAIGVGILVGTAMSAGTGFATGNFSPTGVAVGGAFGAIPGGSTLRGAITIGAASGAGETVVTSALTGQGLPTGGELLFGTVTGSAGGAGSHGLSRLFPPSATPALDHTPSAPQPSGARFVTNSDGVTVDTLANPATNTVSLGHYPAYVEMAQQTGARTFSMSDEAWNAMSPEEQWLRNSRFLDNAISRGDEFRLATAIDDVRPGSYFDARAAAPREARVRAERRSGARWSRAESAMETPASIRHLQRELAGRGFQLRSEVGSGDVNHVWEYEAGGVLVRVAIDRGLWSVETGDDRATFDADLWSALLDRHPAATDIGDLGEQVDLLLELLPRIGPALAEEATMDGLRQRRRTRVRERLGLPPE